MSAYYFHLNVVVIAIILVDISSFSFIAPTHARGRLSTQQRSQNGTLTQFAQNAWQCRFLVDHKYVDEVKRLCDQGFHLHEATPRSCT